MRPEAFVLSSQYQAHSGFRSRGIRSAALAVTAGAALGLTGCAAAPARNPDKSSPQPRIFSIGNDSVLTFESGRDLLIPIDGAFISGLTSSKAVLTVTVTGTSPPEQGEFALVSANQPPLSQDAAAVKLRPESLMLSQEAPPTTLAAQQSGTEVVARFASTRVWLSGRYTGRLRDGDRITVQLEYYNPDVPADAEPDSLAGTRGTVSRVFTVYETTTFRSERIDRSIPVNNIAAFPLPDKQVEQLFGDSIARHYFVVRFGVRNTSGDDWLITASMIRAVGRAMVDPRDQSSRFTVPVTATPESREHVYAVLERRETDSPRSVLFRTLDFGGALATALANAFSWGTDAIRGLGILTGVGVPEGKKLWPDHFESYKRNLVNYAMPQYMKVPRNSMSSAQFIFFSKDDIQALVLDANFFGTQSAGEAVLPRSDASRRQNDAPDAYIIYLAFDNMEIPWEIVVDADLTALNRSAEARIGSAQDRAKSIDAAARSDQRAARALAQGTSRYPVTGSGGAEADARLQSLQKAFRRAHDAMLAVESSDSPAQAEAHARDVESAANDAEQHRDVLIALSDLAHADDLVKQKAAPASWTSRISDARAKAHGVASAKDAQALSQTAAQIVEELKQLN